MVLQRCRVVGKGLRGEACSCRQVCSLCAGYTDKLVLRQNRVTTGGR